MRRALMLLLMIPLAFAAWQVVAGITIVFSAALIGVLFAIGFGFDINELKIAAKEEMFQLIALGVMMAVLVGSNGLLDSISTNEAFAAGSSDLQTAAQSILSDTKTEVASTFQQIRDLDKASSIEGSKAGQCNILGMGYSVSGCGGFSMLATPLSMAGGLTGFALTEVSAMYRLIDISKTYAMAFILPLGILLRTFKITRGAGGFLIALAISLHIMLPAGVIFNQMLLVTFQNDASHLQDPYMSPGNPQIGECNALDTGVIGDSNEQTAIDSYMSLRQSIKGDLNAIMIHATMGPIIALLMFITSLRTLTSLMGAEVDVSGIARFA